MSDYKERKRRNCTFLSSVQYKTFIFICDIISPFVGSQCNKGENVIYSIAQTVL